MNPNASAHSKLLIIGDDLSGTADCAVAGVREGLNCMVKLGSDRALASTECADVLAVDMDSRRSSAQTAARGNVDAWRTLGHPGMRLYKKIDSTLRGNFAPEVAALVPLLGMAIVAPAFPAAGRTTRDARQWVHGVAVEETEVWRNEGIEGRADIAAMLAHQGMRVARLALTDVEADVPALARKFDAWRTDGVQAVVCDCETEQHLRHIAQASASLPGGFWVGSAGLAPELIRALHLRPVRKPAVAEALAGRGPILTVVGSMSSISGVQVATLKGAAGGMLTTLELATDALHAPQPDVTRTVAEALRQGQHVLVALSQETRGSIASGLFFCQRLAALLAPAVQHAGGIIATGGETARALLSAAGISELQVIEEIERGVPLLRASHDGRTLPVVTKAGGFGTPDTIHSAWRRLAGADRADRTFAQPHREETSQ